METAFGHERIERAGRAVLLALGISLALVLLTASGSSTVSGRLGGDFAAFYGAGSIVLDGDIDRLYDPELQTAAQDGLHADEPGFLYFSYAPHIALIFAVFAAVPFGAAYAAYTLLSAGAGVGAVRLASTRLPELRRFRWAGLAAALAFWPMAQGTLQGQNTAFSLLLGVIIWLAMRDGRELTAGAATAALAFKPHFGLAFLGIALVTRRWRMAAVATVGMVAWWLVGALVQGPSWVGDWLERLQWFSENDLEVNGDKSVSAFGAAQAAFGVGSPIAMALGGAVAVTIAGAVALRWLRSTDADLDHLIPLTLAALVVAGPHVQNYDAALALPALLLVSRRHHRLAAGLWMLGLALLLPPLPVSPAGIIALTCVVVLLRAPTPTTDERSADSSDPAETPILSS